MEDTAIQTIGKNANALELSAEGHELIARGHALIAQAARLTAGSAGLQRERYTQRDGERPPGESRGSFLRKLRDLAIPHAVSGKSRIVLAADWWAALARKPSSRRAAPTSGPSADADIERELGLRIVHGGRR